MYGHRRRDAIRSTHIMERRQSTSWDPQEWGKAEHIMGSPGMGGGGAHHGIPRNGGRQSTSWDPQEWGEAEHIMGSPGMGEGRAHHGIPRNGEKQSTSWDPQGWGEAEHINTSWDSGGMGDGSEGIWSKKKNNTHSGSKRPPGVRAYLNCETAHLHRKPRQGFELRSR